MEIFGIILILGLYFGATKTSAGEVALQDISVMGGHPMENWSKYDALFQKYGNQYGVDWQWLKAFALNESNLGLDSSVAAGIANPQDVEGSKSSDGLSWGLMQVTLRTGSDYDSNITPQKLNDPEYSISIAAEFIAHLMSLFDSSDSRYLESVVKSYNEGAGNMRKELLGTGGGFADDYWSRWTRNYNKVKGS